MGIKIIFGLSNPQALPFCNNQIFPVFEILLRSTMKKENSMSQAVGDFAAVTEKQTIPSELHGIQSAYIPFTVLLELQSRLNQQLMINVALTKHLIDHTGGNQSKNGSSMASTLAGNNQKSPPAEEIKLLEFQKRPEKAKRSIVKKKVVEQSQDSDYLPNDSQSNMVTKYKLSQSKNIPKNYGKSILSFIKRQKGLVKKVMDHLGQNVEEFQEHMLRYKNKINTIADLRSIWLEQHEKFAKAFRILSMNYMRKHSFSHIFNSRIENQKKHIKYRYKIFQGLERPQEFTQMKDF